MNLFSEINLVLEVWKGNVNPHDNFRNSGTPLKASTVFLFARI